MEYSVADLSMHDLMACCKNYINLSHQSFHHPSASALKTSAQDSKILCPDESLPLSFEMRVKSSPIRCTNGRRTSLRNRLRKAALGDPLSARTTNAMSPSADTQFPVPNPPPAPSPSPAFLPPSPAYAMPETSLAAATATAGVHFAGCPDRCPICRPDHFQHLGPLQRLLFSLSSSDTTESVDNSDESDVESVDSCPWPEPRPATPPRDAGTPTKSRPVDSIVCPIDALLYAAEQATAQDMPAHDDHCIIDLVSDSDDDTVVVDLMESYNESDLISDSDSDDTVIPDSLPAAPSVIADTEIMVPSVTTSDFGFVTSNPYPQPISMAGFLPSVSFESSLPVPSPAPTISYQPSESVSHRSEHGHRLRSGRMY